MALFEIGPSMFNPFMHNVVEWPNKILKSCGVHTAGSLKYVCPFYNIMHERVKEYEDRVKEIKSMI